MKRFLVLLLCVIPFSLSAQSADNFDLTLAANEGDFAFQRKASSINMEPGCNKHLVLKRPAAGKLFISVFCETTVTSTSGENGFVYSGCTDVLNGVPYKVRVELQK